MTTYMTVTSVIAPGQRGSTESSIIESMMTCIIKFCLSDFLYLNSLVPKAIQF